MYSYVLMHFPQVDWILHILNSWPVTISDSEELALWNSIRSQICPESTHLKIWNGETFCWAFLINIWCQISNEMPSHVNVSLTCAYLNRGLCWGRRSFDLKDWNYLDLNITVKSQIIWNKMSNLKCKCEFDVCLFEQASAEEALLI